MKPTLHALRSRLATLILLLTLSPAVLQAQSGTVQPNWQSINQRPYPQWFTEARLGIFVHWGLYSVPAYASKEGYGEWFLRGLMLGDAGRRHIMSLYADTTLPAIEQYAALANHWHGELWQPDQWARLFRQAGARYVMLVTKHHDGYCLWDSPYQPAWNSTVSGPRRNIVSELTDAVRRQGMRMCFYFSLPEWNNPRHLWMQDPDDHIGDYVEHYMAPQFKELVSRYRPDAIFADGDWQNTAQQLHSEELISWYYNTVGPDAIVNDRWGQGTQHGFRTPEYSAGISNQQGRPWAECRGIGRSFGFNRNEELDNFLTNRQLIQHFCELVADGGGLTLNVGPMADGTIPFIQQERLRALGHWLDINGEAIYGDEPPTDGNRCQPVNAIRIVEHIDRPLPASNTIDYDWVRNAPCADIAVDNFTVVWHGTVTVPATGTYTLRAEADDEMQVIVNGDTLLYYNKAWADNSNAQKKLKLKKDDRLAIEVRYKEKDLEATAHLTWSTDGTTFSPIPAHWQGTASAQRTTRCYTRRGTALYLLLFDRPGQHIEDSLPLLNPKSQITLLGCDQPLSWQQDKQGKLTIDLTSVAPERLNALDYVWVIKIDKYTE